MKKCLISGATGLIGSELVPLLLKEGWDVHALLRSSDNTIPTAVNKIFCNLAEPWDSSGFHREMDVVIHLAQSVHYREFPDYAEELFNINTWSTLRLLDYARKAGAKTFIYTSTGGLYKPGNKSFKENNPLSIEGPISFYFGTKFCAEMIAQNYTPYMNVIILRPFFVYGSGQNEQMLIPRLIRSIKEGIPITIYGPEGLKINPIYVSDAARAIARALYLTKSCKINIAGSEIRTFRQIGKLIGEAVGKKPVFEVKPETILKYCVGDIGKMKNILCTPVVKLADGIEKCIG